MTDSILIESELRLLHLTLGPDYLIDRACSLSPTGDPVLGARAAWREASAMLRHLIDDACEREQADQASRSELHALFSLDTDVQDVAPIDLPYWRSLAGLCSPHGPWYVCSHVRLSVPSAWLGRPEINQGRTRRSAVRVALLLALGRVIQDTPALNRAFLNGRVWQRVTPEIHVVQRFGADDLGVVTVRPTETEDVWPAVRAARARMIRIRKHPLRALAEELLMRWVHAGFIASPAAAMFSDLGSTGIRHSPTPALAPNGVPLSVVAGDHYWDRGAASYIVEVGVAVDHRCIDPPEVGVLHKALRGAFLTD